MSTKCIMQIEATDTFGGEPNYSWIRRFEETYNNAPSDLAAVRRAKKLLGWSGMRCNVSTYGDMIEIRPAKSERLLHVAFITFHAFGNASN